METTDSFLYKVKARAFFSAINDLFYIVSPNTRDFANQGLWPFHDAIFNFCV